MAQFDPSCIKTFTIPGDAVNLHAMIDANIVASAKQGLSAGLFQGDCGPSASRTGQVA